MQTITYQAQIHLPQLQTWWQQWNIPAFSLELLSQTGLIIPEHGCMFMYKTNSPIIQFENLVCNRQLSKELRDQTVKTLVEAGKQYAKQEGFKYILLTTNNPSILQRSQQDGCIISEETYRSILKEVL